MVVEYETFIKYCDTRISVDAFTTYTLSRWGLLGLNRLKNNSVEVNGTHVCSNVDCGRSFERPIKLTVLCSDPVETYLACPFCMSRVELEEPPKPKLWKPTKPTFSIPPSSSIGMSERRGEKEEKEEAYESGKLGCLHSFGYLKNRPKDKPIPDECLTCQKMIQCLM